MIVSKRGPQGSWERAGSEDGTRRRGRRITPLEADRGQALVELAFALPLLLLLMIGAIEIGRFCYAAIEVSNAAGSGAQYGAQNHVTAYDYLGMENAAKNDGANISGLNAVARRPPISTCSDGSTPAGVPLACAGGARLILFVQVNTSATVNLMFQYLRIPPVTLQGRAIMRVGE